ncbi:MAG: PAS domain S-box protein [Candidatus Margulisiibacteriota bacterium]
MIEKNDISIDYCSLVQYSPDYLYILDTEGIILDVNTYALQRLGYKKEELIGKSITALFTPEYQKEFPKRIKKLKDCGYYFAEADIITRNKEIINVECKATAHHNHQGEIERIIVFEHDITAHKIVQKDMREAEKKLGERLKELNCLYEISELAREKDSPLDDLFKNVIELIVRAMQFPETACARIVYKNKEYQSSKFRETSIKLSADIVVDNKARGKIEILYLEDIPLADEGPFIKEERKLINSIAWQLGELIEYRTAMSDLKESRDLYRNLFENAEVGMYQLRLDGSEILAVNKKFTEIIGYSKEELQGMPSSMKWAYPEKRDEMVSIIEKNGQVHDYEYSIKTKTGETKEIMTSVKYYTDKGYIEGSIVDITERKRMLEDLRISEERKRLLLETIINGVQENDLSGKITYVNPSYLKLYAYKDENEVVGRKYIWDDLKDENSRQYLKDYLQKIIIEQPNPTPYNSEDITKDGRTINVRIDWNYLRGQDGEITGFTSVITDITETKQQQEALSKSEETYKALIQNLPQKIFIKDKKSIYISCNDNYASDLNIKREDIAGKTDYDFYPIELAQKYRDDDAKIMSTGEIAEIEEAYMKNGKEYFIHTSKVPLKDSEGKVTGIQGIFWDITERKRADDELRVKTEELECTNKELESFAYAASHDLKAPLRAINNLVSWIEEDMKSDMKKETREKVSLLHSRVNRMDKLLDDLLLYARIGKVERKTEVVDVRKVIEDIIDLLDPPKGFKIDLLGDMPVFETEKVNLEHVLENLIDNAVKHHDRKEGHIKISIKDIDCCYEFTVADDGPGIDKKCHGKVFQLFQTLKPRDEVEGSGMGLALVKKIIEAYGGYLILDSEPGRGTSVQFTWPKRKEMKYGNSDTACCDCERNDNRKRV